MKALILAAGLGTRLRPFTEHTPKPLFTVAGEPLLDIVIQRLISAGCTDIIINTHHLHEQIDQFLTQRSYPVPVQTRFEPEILDTGGAIRNTADFWDDRPFLVVNSDVYSDVDLRKVYDFHCSHSFPATLVLCDAPPFHHVMVDEDDFILGFHDDSVPDPNALRRLTFTGIQVLDPKVIGLMPAEGAYSSISLYRLLIKDERKVKAYIPDNALWKDIGTPESYRNTAYEAMAARAFSKCCAASPSDIRCTPLKGDGSDRKWFRLSNGLMSLILADHGIRSTRAVSEADAFVLIGRHFRAKGVPVPEIIEEDRFSGLVFLEDLGDTSLQQLALNLLNNTAGLRSVYQQVISLLTRLNTVGCQDFEPAWTYQTARYDRDLIIEKECMYFVNAFLKGYLGWERIDEKRLLPDFDKLARNALRWAMTGLMHRDFQSRNIMVKDQQFYVIDFQGARPGPLQYDLASLLLDPYVAMPFEAQEQLLNDCIHMLQLDTPKAADQFRKSFLHCALTRNLQILGAYGFLTRKKNKAWFEVYIPIAVESLHHYLGLAGRERFPELSRVADALQTAFRSGS